MRKILKILIYICILFLIIYNVVVGIKRIKNPNEIPDFFGYRNFIIYSGSMEKTLNIGDIILVKKEKEIQENDIISFKENDAIITHRVTKIIEQDGQKAYKTKGDSNTADDRELVLEEQIQGVYCFKIPQIGIIIMFLQSKSGIILILILLLVVYIFTNKTTQQHKNKGKHSV